MKTDLLMIKKIYMGTVARWDPAPVLPNYWLHGEAPRMLEFSPAKGEAAGKLMLCCLPRCQPKWPFKGWQPKRESLILRLPHQLSRPPSLARQSRGGYLTARDVHNECN